MFRRVLEQIVTDSDRDCDDVLDVVTQARAAGRSRVTAVHVGQRRSPSAAQLRDAGANVLHKKSGRQNLLDTCATGAASELPV